MSDYSVTKDLGAVTAYAEAVEAGYTGTYEKYIAGLKESAEYADNAKKSAQEASDIKDDTQALKDDTQILYDSLTEWGLSVSGGKLCVTYTEEDTDG